MWILSRFVESSAMLLLVQQANWKELNLISLKY